MAPSKTTASDARRMRGLVRALDPPLRPEDLHSGEKMSYLERMPLPKCSQASPKGPWTGFQDEDDPGPFTPDSLDYSRASRSLIGDVWQCGCKGAESGKPRIGGRGVNGWKRISVAFADDILYVFEART